VVIDCGWRRHACTLYWKAPEWRTPSPCLASWGDRVCTTARQRRTVHACLRAKEGGRGLAACAQRRHVDQALDPRVPARPRNVARALDVDVVEAEVPARRRGEAVSVRGDQ
jgi:hypothetical protein